MQTPLRPTPGPVDRRANKALATGQQALKAGQVQQAIAAFRSAVRFAPQSAVVHHALGDACARAQQLTDAADALRKARDLAPSEFRYQLALADVLYLGGAKAEALREYLRATELDPRSTAAWSNAGAIFHQLGEPEQALGALHRALAIDPKHAMALSNSGLAFFDVGEYALARECLNMAVEVKPDYEAARWNRAILDLLHGDFVRGWEGHEYRHVPMSRMGKLRSFPEPRWDGSRFDGKRLLLWPEQGLGDQLQFVRFLPRVKALGGTVVLACAAPLRRLFEEQLDCIDEVVVVDQPYDAVDLQLPLMSIPHVLGLGDRLDAERVPYFSASGEMPSALDAALCGDDAPAALPVRGDDAQEVLPPSARRAIVREPDASSIRDNRVLRVGIVWAGQPKHQNDHNRSIRLETLLPLFDIDGIQWFSLQKGPDAEQQLARVNDERRAAGASRVMPLGDHFTDFVDTAHALSTMDCVITVDTAVAHLAGAMSVPTWILLPFAPDWRWQLHREDTPWYPSVRLFRQQVRGNWANVIASVTMQLRDAVQQCQSRSEGRDVHAHAGGVRV